ncbi:serine protease snake [Drosophila grimshawi]|uniref:GH18678 n=1 Tax=Drosophila grimshawi TaxID=7222 RepID=B4JH22_DROGR|nr:serine protease snake [Drosophila grimshawi]EDV92713.1 GH18678 [Drosophila grimshawi]
MQIVNYLKSDFHLKSLWLLAILTINLVERHLTFAQDSEIVSSCTRYEESVFDLQDGYSFLLRNDPITKKSFDTCHHYIVGGTLAKPKEFAPMARLGYRNADNETKWFCGGTLISNRLVLTAAHCLYSELGAVNVVRLGELDFNSDTEDAQPEDFGVHNSTEHPDFEYGLLYNDIALLELDRGVRFSAYKHPACLPFNDDSNSMETIIAIGWGHTTTAGSDSSKLLKVKLTGVGVNCTAIAIDIDELPNGFNATTQICLGSSDSKDTCNGDSGGPTLIYHKEDPCMYHVMGITSVGIGCGTPNVPSIYTRVHFYLDWIKKEMAKIN